MAYYQGQPRILPQFTGQNTYQEPRTSLDEYTGGSPYNMGVESPYSPPNNGGPGNPGTANNMPKPMLPRFQQFQNNKGPAPLTASDRGMYGGINPGNMYSMVGQLQGMNAPPGFRPSAAGFGQGGSGSYDAMDAAASGNPQVSMPFPNFAPPQGSGQFIPPGGNGGQYTMSQRQPYEQQRQTNNPLNQFGYGGQSPSLGRYVPPMMGNVNDMNSWQGGGGYAYNIPNSYGSGQWNQFNSRDMAFPQFGQPGSNGSMRYRPFNESPPSYQSPFGRPDPARQQNYIAYMMSLAQGQQPTGNNPTQPGAPDQAGPVT